MKKVSSYRDMLFNNDFFVILIVITVFGGWVFCSELNIYILRQKGKSVVGEVTKVNIIENNSLEVEYSYHISQIAYLGKRFYREGTRYDPLEIKEVVAKIKEKGRFPVYYDPGNPKNAICFITHDNLRLNKALGIGILVCWLVWGIGYLQVRIWEKN